MSDQLETPINKEERYMYAIMIRLDALLDQVSSIVEVIANKENVAVTTEVVKKELPQRRSKK